MAAFGCDVIASLLACRGLPTSCRRPGHFSLLAQRKVTKRKGTPAWRCLGLQPGQSVRSDRAFRRGSCPGEKGSASCRSPCGPDRPPLTAAQGAQHQEQQARAAARHIAVAFRLLTTGDAYTFFLLWPPTGAACTFFFLWERTLCATGVGRYQPVCHSYRLSCGWFPQ